MIIRWLPFAIFLAFAGIARCETDLPTAEPLSHVPLNQLIARRWSVDDGLPSNSLNQVLRAADGYVWITSYSGLVRFDGHTFTVFGQPDIAGLETSGFAGLHNGPGGRLWIGTQGSGPWWLDKGLLRPKDSEHRLSTEIVSLLEDHTGVLWAGLEDSGLFRFDDSGVAPIEQSSVVDVSIQDIHQGEDRAIWFATKGKGVTRRTESPTPGGTFRTFGEVDGLPSSMANSLVEDAAGTIWVGTDGGLARIDGDRVSPIAGMSGLRIANLAFDTRGILWATTSKGLVLWAPEGSSPEFLEQAAGYPLVRLTSMSFDHEGSLWLTSRDHGLFQLSKGKFSNYSMRDGLASERVHAVFETEGGEIWVGTDVGVVQAIEKGRVDMGQSSKGQISTVPLQQSLGGAQVMDFFVDREKRLWMSTYAGLLRVEGDQERLFGVADGLPSEGVRWARQDRAGRLWVGTLQGVARQEDDGHFVTESALASKLLGISFSFDETSEGNLLFGARKGLVIFSPEGEVEMLRSGEELPGSLVFSTHIDGEGVVWICTNGGLARLDNGEIAVLSESSGLPVSSIYDLEEDDLGFFWMTSVKGILRVARADLQAYFAGADPNLEIELFNARDGMRNAECTGARRITKSSGGRLWFPTLGGVVSIDPARISKNPVPPPVKITRIEADGAMVDPESLPEIPLGARRLTFSFSALSFQSPSRVRVRHRLQGFDTEWNEALPGPGGPSRTATYTNLPPGRYVLHVIAANNDGVWNLEGVEQKLWIAPLVHQTWWFRAGCVLLVVMLVGGAHFWRVRAMNSRNRTLEQSARERRRWIEQLARKNRELELFASTVSHDLKGPLVTIEGFLGLLEKDLRSGDQGRAQRDMARIREGVRVMARLIDGLLEVSRIGRGEESLQNVDLGVVARQAVDLLEVQIAEKKVEVEIAPDLPWVVGNSQRLLQVYQNLIANAVKFLGGQEAPRIEIGQRSQGREVVFFVRDNGVGIDPAQHLKVFGLFDRLDTEIEGSGLGLAIVQRVIEAHGGRVWVESEGVGHGSTFCFTLPGLAKTPDQEE